MKPILALFGAAGKMETRISRRLKDSTDNQTLYVEAGDAAQAARDFVLGHMNVNIGILYGFIDAQLSDGAKLAVSRARTRIFQPDWKDVFEPENVMKEVKAITQMTSVR